MWGWFKRRKNFYLGIVLIVFGSFVILVSLLCDTLIQIRVPQNLIVIDAGSSQTTAYAFRYGSIDILTSPELVDVKKCDGPIDNIIELNDLFLRENLFRTCLNDIFEGVFKNVDKKDVSLFVGATGGMRTKCANNKSYCDNFEEIIKESIVKSGFPELNITARVISGVEEAFYGWVAVNDEYNIFNKQNNSTLGAIDMGGNSMETAFIPVYNNFTISNDTTVQNYTNTTINQQNYSILTSVIDCAGQDQARFAFDLFVHKKIYTQNSDKTNESFDNKIANNITKNEENLEIVTDNDEFMNINKNSIYYNPCLPNNVSYMVYPDKLYNKCLPFSGYNKEHNIKQYQIVGVQDLDICLDWISEYFGDKSKNSCVSGNDEQGIDKPCLFQDMTLIDDKTKFIAFSSFSYFAHDLGLETHNEQNLETFYKRMKQHCFDEIQYAKFDTNKYCFGIVYGYHILKNVLKITDSNLIFYNNPNKKLAWVEGAAFLLKTSAYLDPNLTILVHNILIGLTFPSIIFIMIGIIIIMREFMIYRPRNILNYLHYEKFDNKY